MKKVSIFDFTVSGFFSKTEHAETHARTHVHTHTHAHTHARTHAHAHAHAHAQIHTHTINYPNTEGRIPSFSTLKDCRLLARDFNFLQNWKALKSVEELNISMNDLSLLPDVPINVVSDKPFLSCFR